MVSKTDLEIEEEEEAEEEELADEVEEPTEAPFKYNNRTEESYKKNKIDPDEWPHNVVYSEPHRFLREVDLSKGPIRRELRRMFRVKEIDYNDPLRKRKEFVYAEFDWYGINKFGEECAPVTEQYEGVYDKVKRRAVRDVDGKVIRYRFASKDKCYYIKFNRKNIDALIAMSAGTDKETIKFCVKGQGPLRTDSLTYNQFVTWTWEQCQDALLRKGGAQTMANPTVT